MKHYVTEAKQAKKRKGYLLPIEGSELEGQIVRGWKYVRLQQRDNSYSLKPFELRLPFCKKVRVWPCTYCGNESHYMAIYQYSGHDVVERVCKKCVKAHGPISIKANDDPIPACNLL